MSRARNHAVVIGASMGGIAAARVLADHFDRVTVLERDELPDSAVPRRAVPQGRHAHALLAGGAQAIAALFPGIVDELEAHGAVMLDFNAGRWFQAGNYRAGTHDGNLVISSSRPFLEGNLRRRAAALPNITIETGVAVAGLEVDGERVRGVRVHADESPQTLTADLVVDCSGRGSPAPGWLEAIGYEAPAVDEVQCDVRYGTTVVPRRADDTDGTFAITIESPPHGKRAGFLIPIEGDRWLVTITAAFGAAAPTDEASFRASAMTLPAPQIHDVIARQETLGPVYTHRLPSSRWRRFDKQSRHPVGFVAMGDAICSFNPIYGQGMSSAVLQAVQLGDALDCSRRRVASTRVLQGRIARDRQPVEDRGRGRLRVPGVHRAEAAGHRPRQPVSRRASCSPRRCRAR